MITVRQNLRLGIRGWRRAPGFALTAILTLAIGIGLSTAVFTVADALLLRRLPVRDQDRVVMIAGEMSGTRVARYPLTLDDAREFARRTHSLESVAYFADFGSWPKPIRDGDRVSRLRRAIVSANFFDVLGAHATLGRPLHPGDDVAGAAPVIVLSYAAWQQRFGGDPHVLGHRIVTYDDSTAYTVVGVMAQGLEFPRGTEFWAPIVPSSNVAGLKFVTVNLVGRLTAGAAPARARDEMTAFFARAEAPAWQHRLHGVVTTLPQLALGDTRLALLVFAAACALLLLITCTNVASLLLVRGLARTREMAVRTALGASRAQIMGQLLTESTLLAIAGGALGVVFAAGAVRAFVSLAPAGVPRVDEIQVNVTALAAAIGITAIAVLIFAVVPALVTSRVDPQHTLRSGSRQTASRKMRLAMEGLVVGQLALSLLVLSAASLIARSFINLERAKLGFEPSHVLIADLTLKLDQYDSEAKQRAVIERLVSRVQSMPGVVAVSPTVAPPFSGNGGWDGRPRAEGQTDAEAAADPLLNIELVTPSYFQTFTIPVIRGRSFTADDRDGAPPVTILSESAAKHYWPNANPIGRRLMNGPKGPAFTVVGLVADTRYRELRDARATIYFPLRQSFFPFAPWTLAVRTSGPPSSFAQELRRAVTSTAPGVAVASAAPFDSFLDGPLAQPRLNAVLLALFAGAAVALAAVGLFGVLATLVRQRTNEFGVRMALGATAGDVRRSVMRRGLAIGVSGSALGLVGAMVTNRLLSTLLYDVQPADEVTLAAVTALLVGIAVAASLIPAQWSARIDPVEALRADA